MVLCGGGIVEPKWNACALRLHGLRKTYPELQPRAFAISTDHSVRYPFRIRRALRAAFDHLDEVFVRDEYSREALAELLPRQRVTTVGDIVLNLPAGALPATVAAALPPRYLCLTLADVWTDHAFLDWAAHEAAALGTALDAAVVLAPISTLRGEDLALHAAVAERIRQIPGAPPVIEVFAQKAPIDPGAVAALYRGSALNVSMRLHGCVISYAQRTPFVALSYHPKLQGFAETVGWSDFVLPAQFPKTQSKGVYGYAFRDLNLPQGALVETGLAAADCTEFSGLDYFRMRQRRALRRALAA
jgi:polysaccharide pyruvyl transferase WcaK-like protein